MDAAFSAIPAEKREPTVDGPSPDRTEGSLWTVGDVACFLGVAPKTVRKWQLNGTLPFVKLGGKLVRFHPAAVRAWVDDHAVTARPGDEGSPLVAELRRRLAQ